MQREGGSFAECKCKAICPRYIAYNIPRDARWITASIFFMLGYISYTTGSVFLGVSVPVQVMTDQQ